MGSYILFILNKTYAKYVKRVYVGICNIFMTPNPYVSCNSDTKHRTHDAALLIKPITNTIIYALCDYM